MSSALSGCESMIIAGYSTVIGCCLEECHTLPHRSESGQSWVLTPDDDPTVVSAYAISGGRWQAEGLHWHPVALLARRGRTSEQAADRMQHDLAHYRRTGRRTASQVIHRVIWRVKQASRG